MRNGLSVAGVSSRISAVEDVSRDAVFLGLYDNALDVGQYLQAAGISIDDVVNVPSALQLDRVGTAITLLHREEGRHVLVILADTSEALSEAVEALLSGDFRKDLVNDFMGVRS